MKFKLLELFKAKLEVIKYKIAAGIVYYEQGNIIANFGRDIVYLCLAIKLLEWFPEWFVPIAGVGAAVGLLVVGKVFVKGLILKKVDEIRTDNLSAYQRDDFDVQKEILKALQSIDKTLKENNKLSKRIDGRLKDDNNKK